MNCPFCSPGDLAVEIESGVGFVVRDRYPSAPGHRLVIPRIHVGSIFDLDPETRQGLWQLVDRARDLVVAEVRPSGLNVGVNAGAAAGQTVGHAHIHVIPRHAGDVDDPRGGVRWVLPRTAKYWDE
jgi:diadenosine tetraphosphate (Ap4A) HIT family hydrolase